MKVDAEEELKKLLGERMATKLLSDCEKSAEEFSKALADLTHRTLQQRLDLCKDDLTEPRYLPLKEEAEKLLAHIMTNALSCRVLGTSCVLHAAMERRMSEFVSHAAGHYEIELESRKAQRVGDILSALLNRRDEADEEVIHTAARAHSSSN